MGSTSSLSAISCGEIRRLFWQLVLAVERTVTALLDWSNWRRWHQAWARYYHHRRRAHKAPEHQVPELDASHAQVRQMNVTDVVWSRLEPLLHQSNVLVDRMI